MLTSRASAHVARNAERPSSRPCIAGGGVHRLAITQGGRQSDRCPSPSRSRRRSNCSPRVASMYYLEDLTQEPSHRGSAFRARRWGACSAAPRIWASCRSRCTCRLASRCRSRPTSPSGSGWPRRSSSRTSLTRTGSAIAPVARSSPFSIECSTATARSRSGWGETSEQSASSRPCSGRGTARSSPAIGGSAQVGGGLNSTDVVSPPRRRARRNAEGPPRTCLRTDQGGARCVLGHDDVARTLEQARAADVAVVGIGDADVESLVVRLGCITADDMVRMRTDGAVGDILGSFFNVDGQPIAEWIEERVVGLTRDDLRRIPNVIAVAFEARRPRRSWGPSVPGSSTRWSPRHRWRDRSSTSPARTGTDTSHPRSASVVRCPGRCRR